MLRRGYSLVELLMALTVGAVIVGICVGTLHSLWRTEKGGRARAAHARIVAQLAEQFRTDVAAASQQSPEPGPGQWQFDLPDDQTVTYRALPGEVRRMERAKDKLVRQESYLLPTGWTAAIAVEEPPPTIVRLILRDDRAPSDAVRELQVVAALGKDHRFTKKSEGGR